MYITTIKTSRNVKKYDTRKKNETDRSIDRKIYEENRKNMSNVERERVKVKNNSPRRESERALLRRRRERLSPQNRLLRLARAFSDERNGFFWRYEGIYSGGVGRACL